MKRRELLFTMAASAAAQDYALGPDSQRKAGVPQGKVTQASFTSAKIYPGTVRDYWVYVPAQYDAAKAAALMVLQDGAGHANETGAWRTPAVFDNLIHAGAMPPVIGVFVNPGVLPASNAAQQARYNRSYEYDAVGDRYARFLIEELLPEVAKSWNLTSDPNLRAIGGSSSGAICAFNAAWFRPDAFRRVLSFIGSYVNLRGGHVYPSLVRKTEPKPLRVFLQDGDKDLNIYSGDWWMANQDLARALEFAGYEYTFVTGHEGHNNRHGAAILPDALRWLWRDWQKPISKPTRIGDRQFSQMIVEPGAEWEKLSEGHRFTEGPAVDKTGQVFFTDIPNNRIHRIDLSGKVEIFVEDTGGTNGLMFGADGRLYGCQNGRQRIAAWTMDGKEEAIAEGVRSNDLCINAKGDIWFTDPPGRRVWHVRAGEKPKIVRENLNFPNGVVLSSDQSLLLVAEMNTRTVWSFQVNPDGTLANPQPFYRMEVPDERDNSGADGMTVDTEGHLYVATDLGVQVCDQPGRVVAILNKPQPGSLSNVVFGGADLQWLYATAGDKVFRRRMRRKGLTAWAPVKPPQPRL